MPASADSHPVQCLKRKSHGFSLQAATALILFALPAVARAQNPVSGCALDLFQRMKQGLSRVAPGSFKDSAPQNSQARSLRGFYQPFFQKQREDVGQSAEFFYKYEGSDLSWRDRAAPLSESLFAARWSELLSDFLADGMQNRREPAEADYYRQQSLVFGQAVSEIKEILQSGQPLGTRSAAANAPRLSPLLSKDDEFELLHPLSLSRASQNLLDEQVVVGLRSKVLKLVYPVHPLDPETRQGAFWVLYGKVLIESFRVDTRLSDPKVTKDRKKLNELLALKGDLHSLIRQIAGNLSL